MSRFVVKCGYDRDEGDEYYVDDVWVGHSNYDEHGSAGMEALETMFTLIAGVLGEVVKHVDRDEEDQSEGE